MVFLAAVPAVIGIADGIINFATATSLVFEVVSVDAVGGAVASALTDATLVNSIKNLTKSIAKKFAKKAVTTTPKVVAKMTTRESIIKALSGLLKMGLTVDKLLKFALSVTSFVLLFMFKKQIEDVAGWTIHQIWSWVTGEKKRRYKEISKTFRMRSLPMVDALRAIKGME
jgi:hypothetical protein